MIRLRLITFDVTNTLMKFTSTPGHQYGEVGALYGIACDEATLTNHFTTHYRKMNREHPIYGRNTGLNWEQWWRIIVKDSFKDCDINIEEKKLDAVASHLINRYKTSMVWRLHPGAYGLLSYIRSKGVPMGVVTNHDPRVNPILINIKLRHYFQFVLTSYDVGFEKPDPQIFSEAMRGSKIKDLQPAECLHIGDEKLNDYDGPRNSGWHAFLVIEAAKEFPKDVNRGHVFNNLYELHRHLIENSNESLFSHTV